MIAKWASASVLLVSLEATAHHRAFQFPQSVCGNPTGGFRRLLPNAPGTGYGCSVQCGISLADVAQCPVDRLLDEIPVVTCGGLHQRQGGYKGSVAGRLVVYGQRG